MKSNYCRAAEGKFFCSAYVSQPPFVNDCKFFKIGGDPYADCAHIRMLDGLDEGCSCVAANEEASVLKKLEEL